MRDLEIQLKDRDEQSLALAKFLVIEKIVSKKVLNRKKDGDHIKRYLVNGGGAMYM